MNCIQNYRGGDMMKLTPEEIEEILERTTRLRRGEEVICRKCKKGIMLPVGGNYKTTPCFKCNNCGNRINLD